MTYDEYLRHSGILGMRWGVRNGPPYPLSRRAMSISERKENPASGESKEGSVKVKKPEKSVYVETEQGVKTDTANKSVKKMSNKELKDVLDRMSDEKKFREYSREDLSNGKNFVKNVLLAAGAAGISAFVIGSFKKAGEKGSEFLGNKLQSTLKEKDGSKAMSELVKEFTGPDGNVDMNKVKSEKSMLEMLKNIGDLRKGAGKGKQ